MPTISHYPFSAGLQGAGFIHWRARNDDTLALEPGRPVFLSNNINTYIGVKRYTNHYEPPQFFGVPAHTVLPGKFGVFTCAGRVMGIVSGTVTVMAPLLADAVNNLPGVFLQANYGSGLIGSQGTVAYALDVHSASHVPSAIEILLVPWRMGGTT